MSKGPWKKGRKGKGSAETVTVLPNPADILQERIDILVTQHPDATGLELWTLWSERNDEPDPREFFPYLRWPPGLALPDWAQPPKLPPPHEYDGPRTPLVADLLSKLDARSGAGGRSRPLGRVDYGNKSEPGEKD